MSVGYDDQDATWWRDITERSHPAPFAWWNPEDGEHYAPEFTVAWANPAAWRRITLPDSWFVYCIYSREISVSVPPLYVGQTCNLANRLESHKKTKAWWPLAGGIIVSLHSTKWDALDHERRYIKRTSPLFNTIHNQHTDGKR